MMSAAGGVFTLTIISVFNGAINQGAAERNDHGEPKRRRRLFSPLVSSAQNPLKTAQDKLNRTFILLHIWQT